MGHKGNIPVKACWNCYAILPSAKHICTYCGTAQNAYTKAYIRVAKKDCAEGKHDYRNGECYFCEQPEVKP